MEDIVIDTDEIKEFFVKRLAQGGYVPTEDEVAEIADITFDYLVYIGLIDEV